MMICLLLPHTLYKNQFYLLIYMRAPTLSFFYFPRSELTIRNLNIYFMQSTGATYSATITTVLIFCIFSATSLLYVLLFNSFVRSWSHSFFVLLFAFLYTFFFTLAISPYKSEVKIYYSDEYMDWTVCFKCRGVPGRCVLPLKLLLGPGQCFVDLAI